jgi:FAD/FMN-containing dehydrogenase
MSQIIYPEDPDFDTARAIFNAMIDRRPARIVKCAATQEVASAVRDAKADGLSVSVYGGGHSVAGAAVADGAACIDLRGMDGVVVDAQSATARVGGGARWGQVDAAAQEHGLAVTGGRVSTTGVGGLALGSGSGWLERKLGFSCDNLISAEVVTAAGEIVTASESENSELFWAIRGGGGNFGIVTEFTFKLSPVGPIVLGGMLLYPAVLAGPVLKNWRDFMRTAPDEVGSAVALITAPDAPFVPEPARGKPCVGVVICYAGDVDEGSQVVTPLTDFGPPVANLVGPMPYVEVQKLLDPANAPGNRNYWTADFYNELPDDAIEALVANGIPAASPLTQIIVAAGGGAVSRVPFDATAFSSRDASVNIHYLSAWPQDQALDAANIAYTKQVSQAMKPWSSGRVYLNYIGDEGSERVSAAFEPERFARLRSIKKAWDPENIFRHNQNIPPA